MEETARKAEEKATELMDKLALVSMYRDNYGGKSNYSALIYSFHLFSIFSLAELQSCETAHRPLT